MTEFFKRFKKIMKKKSEFVKKMKTCYLKKYKMAAMLLKFVMLKKSNAQDYRSASQIKVCLKKIS